jgi:16S rRNA (cytidine1402-2'-O)-methyltransferase
LNTALETLAAGCLYVVATPIGNLGDLSPRALAVLGAVDAICAEDTRTTGQLLAHFGLRKPMLALHDHNETRVAEQVIERLRQGLTLALVSDAGTPLVSDPGYALVKAVREAGLELRTVPGPCALIAALSIAGLPTDEFSFVGFLPAKSQARRARLEALALEPRTWVFYEAPHRVLDCARDLAATLPPDRPVFVGRELTKRFEQGVRMTVAELPVWIEADANHARGEFVFAVAGAPVQAASRTGAVSGAQLLRLLVAELSPSKAAKLAAELTGEPRKDLYAEAVRLAGKETPSSET